MSFDSTDETEEAEPSTFGEVSDELAVQAGFEGITNRIVEQPPIVKTTEPLARGYNVEVPGDLEVTDDGRLLMRYLRYTNLYSDITEGFEQMLRSMSYLISNTYIQIDENNYILFNRPDFIADNRTPLYCRQHNVSYLFQVHINAYKIVVENKRDIYGNIVTGADGKPIRESKPVTDQQGNIIYYSSLFGEMPIMVGSSLCITVRKKMTPQERFEVGECPDDPAGYFIIDGSEYIVGIQDKLRTNIQTCYFDKDQFKNRMTCDNYINSTVTVVIKKNKNNIYNIEIKFLAPEKSYQINDINVLLIYQVLGLNSYQDIKNMILYFTKPQWRGQIENELLTTFGDLSSIKDPIKFFAEIRKDVGKTEELRQKYISQLERELFPQYSYVGNNRDSINLLKLYTVSMMISRLAETAIGLRPPDDRDSWSMKRVVTAGPKMYQLFNLEWRKFILKVDKKLAESKYNINSYIQGSIKSLLQTAQYEILLKKTFEDSFKTMWGNERYNKKQKFTEILKRESKLSPWANINKVSTPGSKENKKLESRAGHFTQFGYFDIVDTPEGKEGCGTTKHKAITCLISSGGEDIRVIQYLNELRERNLFSDEIKYNSEIFILNGKIMGQCVAPEVYKFFINKRRNGLLKKDIMIILDQDAKILHVYTDSGRPTRPLLIINSETGALVIDELNSWDKPIDELLSTGCMEYIDSYEQEFLYVAKSIREVRDRKTSLEELSRELAELKTSQDIFTSTQEVKSDQLNKEKKNRLKNLHEAAEVLQRFESEHDVDIKSLIKLKDEFSKIHEDKATGIDEIRLKFIDVYYEYGRLVKRIKIRDDVIKKLREKYENLKRINETEIIYSEYFESQIDITMKSIEKLIQRRTFTHCELHPGAIFGTSASIIPMANRNPATRVGFQCNMGRQALGIYHSNFQQRFDTTAKMLANPSAPIVSGQINDIIGLDKYSHGENVILAVMEYLQYNVEDSVIINQASIDRGLFRMLIRKTVTITISKTTKVSKKDMQESESVTKTPYEGVSEPRKDRINVYRHLGEDGIARVESVLNQGDCLVGIKKTIRTRGIVEVKDVSKFVDKDYEGYVVDTIGVTEKTGEVTISIVLRDYRFPIKGDKFASRIAQKSTIGIVLPEADMPFTENGIKPDLIINPNAFTSRATISHLLEMLLSKAGALSGTNIKAATFGELDINKFMDILSEHGYNRWGYERMINGMTGKLLKAEIYLGPIFYQALKHHAKDKIQVRQRGVKDQMTRQAVKGKKRNGGIRFGEMERDTLISHGASEMLYDTHCVSSNAYTCIICRKCNRMFDITFSIKDKKFKCRLCGDNSDIVRATAPYTVITLSGILELMNVNLTTRTALKKD